MIPTIDWERRFGTERRSAFHRGVDERPVRVTFHTEGLEQLPPDEQEALDVLEGMGHLPEVDAMTTQPGSFPYVTVREADVRDDLIPIDVRHPGGRIHTAHIWHAGQWEGVAARLIGQQIVAPTQPDTRAALDHLLVAQAHHYLDRDLFVTGVPWMLARREDSSLRHINPRSPVEAARIVGLFLRTRGVYAYHVWAGGRASFDRGFFYWVLARHLTPGLWRYFGACVHSQKQRQDDVQELGESVLVRCVRALEARDALGEQVYSIPGDAASERALYHFDYLTLLLSGVFDAMARVARRVYGLPVRERAAGFRNEEFRRALQRHGAQSLFDATDSGSHFAHVVDLITGPRNAIHGAAWRAWHAHADSSRADTFVTVPQAHWQEVWWAAQQLGSLDNWGLFHDSSGVRLDPYTYATQLVAETFRAVNTVADATEVERLFGTRPVPQLGTGPPEDGVFDVKIRRRVAILGGPGP